LFKKITIRILILFIAGSVSARCFSQHVWKGSWIKDSRDINLKPAPYFRKEFKAKKKIVSAYAYIAVAGLYELYINGKKIGDHVLDPMYTRFDRRNLYVAYDVTHALTLGNNCIGVLLGNGWYNMQSTAVWYFDKAPWRNRPCFCLDLEIDYSDGTKEIISTDKSWKTIPSPIIFNSIYTGEHYDARKEIENWDQPGLIDTTWSSVLITGAPSKNIAKQSVPPIGDMEEIPAMDMRKINDTDYVFNIGRNISGASRIWLDGPEGTIVKLKHGEKLDSFGHVDQSNINVHYRPTDEADPFQTDIYILNGKGKKWFQPHFNYKGFQYVEVTCDKPISLIRECLDGIFLHSDVEAVGKISCSDSIIDKLWQATNNSYLSNLFGYPTDCPQREKNGWTADAHLAIETGLYNFDSKTIYEKWMADIRDEQGPNGMFPAIIPSSGWGYEHFNTVDWLSALVIIPWELYLFYGDSKPLKDNYEAMKLYIDHLNDVYPDGLTPEGLGDREAIQSQASVELTSTCYYYADATILTKASRLLDKKNDEIKYNNLALKIKAAFNKKFYQDNGIYGSGYQTEFREALYWGLVPLTKKKIVAKNLADACSKDSIHFGIGVLGSKTLLNALSDNGYADIAYKLASKTTYPSYGYWMKSGMTTLPETWNMSSSLNHIFFGETSAWFYKALGGIKPDPKNPGFKNILLEPHFVKDLDSFYCEHKCFFGKIVSSWKRSGNKIVYKITIPANSTASLILPKTKKVSKLNPGSYQFKISE
jgi:alpha-L-rhamnosidase